ncbi:MAG: DNA translocase FtsK, partial [Prevotellaceae bacterium]|nr:DNA translocase FtsK [Prevotellaceae bacterium]
SIKVRMFTMFVKSALLLIVISFVLSVIAKILPITGHVKLGGNCGDALHTQLVDVVGDIGVYLIIVLAIVFMLVYFGKATIDGVVNFINKFKRAKEIPSKLRGRLKDGADADEEGEEEELPEDTPVQQTQEFEDPEKSSTLIYDAEGNLVSDTADTETEHITEDNIVADETDVASAFDAVVRTQSSAAEDVSEEDAEPEFVINEVTETEVGSGKIEHDDELTPYDPKKDLEHYKYPGLDLLDHNSESSTPSIDMAEQHSNQERIKHVLKTFGVEVQTIKATIGPTITLYEITLAEGTRINKIRNLEDDIALSLAAEGIRIIAPIPGKGTIGIEVPNKKKCIVSMESILKSKTYQESKMELPCAIGKTITNEVFMVDLAKAPHMLVAGATGQGKSVGLNAIITSLLYKKHPSELKMVMVDPKKVEFSVYAPIANQFLAKLEDEEEAIITDNQRVVKTLNALCKLMDDRYMLLKQAHVRNLKEYNDKFKARKLNPLEGHEYMPYYVVIIDEFGDLIMTAGKEIELPICRIAQLARAVGIHMIIATQRPTTRIITGTIKANFPARVAFKVSAMMDSRIILDRPGANQLIGRGDMLYLQSADPVRVQCAFVDTPEVNRICEFISKQQQFPQMTYLPEPPMDDTDGGSSSDIDVHKFDSMFAEVAKMVVAKNQGSTSFIQRNFSIGFARAGRLMDQLEKAGIVGPASGSKPREVLIQDLLTLESLLNTMG